MIYTFYVLATLLLLQGLVSLIEGWRYLAFVRRSLAAPPAAFTPKASVIVPCKGLEPELEANLRALLQQNYPSYEILFVVATPTDAALPLIQRVLQESHTTFNPNDCGRGAMQPQ